MLLRSAELDSWVVENEAMGLLAVPRGRSLGLSSESLFFSLTAVPLARRSRARPVRLLFLVLPRERPCATRALLR